MKDVFAGMSITMLLSHEVDECHHSLFLVLVVSDKDCWAMCCVLQCI